jgi:hypothetical protein
MGVYIEKSKKITGAGVIIVEDYKNYDNKLIPTILVVKNRASGYLSDFGGSYSKKHFDISETAANELREESINLIDIPSDILAEQAYYDIPVLQLVAKDTYYRVFVIKAKNISGKYFFINKKIIDSHPDSKNYWKETKSIHHIPIDTINFDTLLDRKTVKFKDVHNKTNKIHMRLRKVLFYGKYIINEVLKEDPLVSKDNIVIETEQDFKSGTYVFRYQ